MPRATPGTFASVGFAPELERTYWRALTHHGAKIELLAAAFGVSPAEAGALLDPLVDRGLLAIEDGRVNVLAPAEAIATLVRNHAAVSAEIAQRLEAIAVAIPHLVHGASASEPESDPVDGEVLARSRVVGVIDRLVGETGGDLLWMRPDQWRLPSDPAMASAVTQAMAAGRRSRAIVPMDAIRAAPRNLLARAAAGEQLRVVGTVPTRLAVLGRDHAVVQQVEGWGSDRPVLVRQPALVKALTTMFELWWDRATPVPSLDRFGARLDMRRLLLEQLAAGAKDEQIARTLGVSLRTVRRRVAGLMIDLGVDTRFQAGVEAARRGWL